MRKYLHYFSYVFRHKWYVFLACLEYRLIWQGIIHDWSKFLPSEFIPYSEYFYGGDKRKDGFYTHDQGTVEFNTAWLKHIHRNPHHWQYWMLQEDEGSLLLLDMPVKYMKEMICDWKGAGRAQGNNNVLGWYTRNRKKIKISEATRNWVEKEIGYVSNN